MSPVLGLKSGMKQKIYENTIIESIEHSEGSKGAKRCHKKVNQYCESIECTIMEFMEIFIDVLTIFSKHPNITTRFIPHF